MPDSATSASLTLDNPLIGVGETSQLTPESGSRPRDIDTQAPAQYPLVIRH